MYILITMWGCFCWSLSVTLSSYNRFSSSRKGRAVESDYSRKRNANVLSAAGASDGMQNSHVHLLQTWHFVSQCVHWKKCPYTTHTHRIWPPLSSSWDQTVYHMVLYESHLFALLDMLARATELQSVPFSSQEVKKTRLQVNISCCEGAPCNILCLSRMICNKLTLR